MSDLRDMAKEAVLLRDQALVDSINREYTDRMKARGLTGNPLQGFGYQLLLQAPWTATMFLSIRGMSIHPDIFPSFAQNSSLLWCPSLALPDPLGLVPLISTTAVVLSSSKLSGKTSSAPAKSLSERDRKYVEYAVRGACFTFLPIAMQLPAGIFIFFMFNTLFNRIVAPVIYKRMQIT